MIVVRMIEFKTSVDEKVIEGSASYDNTASYTNQGSSRDVTGKVSIQHGGESVKKVANTTKMIQIMCTGM